MRPPKFYLFNAKIYTQIPERPTANSLLVSGNQIEFLDPPKQVLKDLGTSVEMYDLEGMPVLPGFTDAHIHLSGYAQSLSQVRCETPTLEECLERVGLAAQSQSGSKWIRGHGWNQNLWRGFGNSRDLDAVSPDHPVFLVAKSGHAFWVNSMALKLAGIDEHTQDPDGGAIQRDEHGVPTGILFEEAGDLVRRHIEKISTEDLVDLIALAQERLLSKGITSVHDFDGIKCFSALQQLREQGKLDVRVVKNFPDRYLDLLLSLGFRTGFGDPWIKIGNLKVFADGALGPRTASMLEAYKGEPQNFGISLIDQEELLEISMKAAKGGIAMTVHAIGDKANHEVLNAFRGLRAYEAEIGAPHYRHRVEHLQLLHQDDVELPAKLNLIASMQPIHATSDQFIAEKYWGQRTQTSYAWRSQISAGATLAFGSDAPVESPNPFLGLHAAVTRRDRTASPDEPSWIPDERITLEQAIAAYTKGPAYAANAENMLGQLRPGYLADLIVVSDDPFRIDEMELANLTCEAAMVDGEWRYGHSEHWKI